MHEGIDISGVMGQPIYAVVPGIITKATANGAPGFSGYGHTVTIDHPGRWHSMYAHLSSPAVRVGQHVRAGELIGYMGNTNGAKGVPSTFSTSMPHLHFEVSRQAWPKKYGAGNVDPELWLYTMGFNLPTGAPVNRARAAARLAALSPEFVPAPAAPQVAAVPMAPMKIARALKNAADMTGVPVMLLGAVAYTESRFNPAAVSSAGAQGLMQLMPRTAEALGVTNPFDPRQSALGAAGFLKRLHAKYGDWSTALAAYNWGPGNVDRSGGRAQWPGSVKRYVANVLGAQPAPAGKVHQPGAVSPAAAPRSSPGGGGAAAVAVIALLGLIGFAASRGRG